MHDPHQIAKYLGDIYRGGRPLALLLDYDGSLVPDGTAAGEATMPDAARRALRRLASTPNVRLGVLSSRALTQVRRLVNIEDIYYSGTGGLELCLRGCTCLPAGYEAAQAVLDQVAGRLTDLAASYPGAWVEQKPLGLNLHYGAVAGRLVGDLEVEAAEALDPWLGRVREEYVRHGLEVTPELGWDQGTAVWKILRDAGEDAYPVFAGDPADNLAALGAVEAAGGLTIGVGPAESIGLRPRARLRGPAEVASMLSLLADAVGGVNGNRRAASGIRA